MRFKIFIFSLILIAFIGLFAFLNFPIVMQADLLRKYIDGYIPLVNKGFYIIMILTWAYLITLIIDRVLEHTFTRTLRNNTLAKKLLPLIETITSVFVWIVAAIFILTVIGVNISALVTWAGIGGIIFALASKEAASNLFGSLSLIFSKNFKIGDNIKVKGYEGIVEEISLSYTRLVDKKGTVIFMPNKNIVSETIENISMAPSKLAEFNFSLPASLSSGDTDEILDNLEVAISDLEKELETPLRAHASIEGITDTSQSILIKVESEEGNMTKIKRDVWMIIKDKMDGIKTK